MNRNYANQIIRFRFGEQCQINTVYLLIYIFIERNTLEMKPIMKNEHTQTKLNANFYIPTNKSENFKIDTNFYTKIALKTFTKSFMK